MKFNTLYDSSDIIDKLDSIEMSELDRERARQIAQRAEKLVCLSFAVGGVPGILVARLRRLLRPKIRNYSTSK